MERIPRSTALLVLILAGLVLVLVGLGLSREPRDPGEVRTHMVHEMVATAAGLLETIGLQRGGPFAEDTNVPWRWIVLLVAVTLGLWVARGFARRAQQRSRIKRS